MCSGRSLGVKKRERRIYVIIHKKYIRGERDGLSVWKASFQTDMSNSLDSPEAVDAPSSVGSRTEGFRWNINREQTSCWENEAIGDK